jgi:hypothetical protein
VAEIPIRFRRHSLDIASMLMISDYVYDGVVGWSSAGRLISNSKAVKMWDRL